MGRYAPFFRSIPYLFLIVAAGCAHLPVTGTLPDTARITELTRVDADSPFALDAAGESVAFVDGGLRLKELASGNERPLSADAPTALAWSPDGKQLVAAFSQVQETVLRLYDRQGNVLSQGRLAGRVNSLAWRSSSEILAFVVKQRVYRFGAHLAQLLYRWDGKSEPAPTPLHETTLMPAFMQQWEGVMQRTLTFALSPLDDEIIYARLYAPPAFAPYLKLTLRHLESGTEREIADVSLLSAGGAFPGDGEKIVYGDGERESWLFDPWGNRALSTMPSPGRALALSPSGRYLLLDGHLYREGREIASFPAESVGAFASRGGRLALRNGGRLYLVTNLPEELATPPDPAVAARLRQLHKWLSEGLISAQDYRKAMEKKAQ
jgi:hypothetical protein